jgi:hypothetical protein
MQGHHIRWVIIMLVNEVVGIIMLVDEVVAIVVCH